jgi:hypothetical protein
MKTKLFYKYNRADYICGLNLPELFIAICIMALAVMTITGMFIAGMMGLKKGNNLVVASNLAQSTIELYEEEIIYDFNKYSQSSSPYTLPDAEFDNIKFTRKMAVKDFTDPVHNITNRLKKVEISIYWYEKSLEGKTWDKPKEIKFSTYINNYLDYPERTP